MKSYKTSEIRNIVLLGHGGCGKTSLTEAIALQAGIITRAGKVTTGNTISDFDKEEIKRGFSISTSVVPVEWEGYKINVIDTPGYFDFIGEVEEAVSVADAAVIVVSGKSGVEVGTEKAWELCEKYNLPRMVFVTEMDVDNASFREVVENLTSLYGKRIAPFHQPIREHERLVGYVNVVKMAGRRWLGGTAEAEDCEIPEYSMPNLKICREALLEAVAETNEEYMDRYFAGEEFTEDEIKSALRENVCEGTMVPVTMGSAVELRGVFNLLNDIVKYLPAPGKRQFVGTRVANGDIFEGNYDENAQFSGYIFKTIVDAFIGKYSFVKVCTGVLKNDASIYNHDKGSNEKISKLYVLRGNKPIEVKEAYPGDICAIAKLGKARTGDTISSKENPIVFEKFELSKPYTYMRYRAKKKGDEDKISQAFSKMMHEDLTIKTVNDEENRQLLIYGMGDMHLEVISSKLEGRYKVEVELSRPKVAFRETIKKSAQVQGKYKKQSGGHGQYGDVKMIFEPLGNTEQSYVFEERVVGGAVPKNFFPAVEKGIQEGVQKGPLAAYPVVGIKAILFDGSYHTVDSSEMAFKTAAKMAFKKGIMEASPVLLEPIANLKVVVPDGYTGDIMGDLNKRRGRVLGMNPLENGKQCIEADIPMKELYGYCTVLRSMTGGWGSYSYEFKNYEQAPSDVQQKEVEARASKLDNSED